MRKGDCVSDIRFRTEDLARVRMMVTLGRSAEAVFALETLERTGNSLFGPWRQQVQMNLGAQASTVRTLIGSLRPVPDLLWMMDRSRTAQTPRRLGTAGLAYNQVAQIVNAFSQVAVSPYWHMVRSHLQVELDARSRLMASGGVERLLSTLNSKVVWNWDTHTLEIPGDGGVDVDLSGRGLLLVPSLFLTRRPAILLGADEDSADPPILVFAAPPDPSLAGKLWGTSGSGDQALSALVGRTRAALLRAVSESGTTGELADRLGISSAGISQHTGVLRQAGLITTSRNRNSVLHTLTPLGVALLGGDAVEMRPRLRQA